MTMNFELRHWLWLLAASSALPASLHAQVIPKLQGAAVQAAVDPVPGDVVHYRYRLKNGSDALVVDRIEIDLLSDASRLELPAAELGTPPGFSRSMNLSTEPHVAAVSATRPPQWFASIDVNGNLGWYSAEEVLAPGSEAITVSLESKGLPGIRDVTFVPDLWDYLPNVDETDGNFDPAALAAAVDAANQVVTTIGPIAPPREFSALAFAEEILQLRDRARTLGWIRSGAEANSVDGLLSALHSALASQSITPAHEAISQLIQVVDSTACSDFVCGESSPFTAEARALLVVNLRYLKDRLPPSEPL